MEIKMAGTKNMVERPAHQPIVCAKCTEESAPNSWVEKLADYEEQTRCIAPRHVIQIAGYNNRHFALLCFFSDNQYFRIAFGRFFRLAGNRRLWMQSIEPKQLSF